jgi:hypothetical protein
VDTCASPASHVDHVESCCLCTSGQECASQAFPKPSYHNQMPSWKKVKFGKVELGVPNVELTLVCLSTVEPCLQCLADMDDGKLPAFFDLLLL